MFFFLNWLSLIQWQGSAKLINRTHAAGAGQSFDGECFALLSLSSLRIRGECLCVQACACVCIGGIMRSARQALCIKPIAFPSNLIFNEFYN